MMSFEELPFFIRAASFLISNQKEGENMPRSLRRVLSCFLFAFLLFLFIVPAIAAPVPHLDKTATPLTSANETHVTLRIAAEEGRAQAAVVFVLDRSASVDVRTEALAMLDELSKQAVNGDIQVAVVKFAGTASTKLNWLPLTTANLPKIKTAINSIVLQRGTNISAGVWLGKQLLDQALFAPADCRHLVLVTDALPRMWSLENGAQQAIYSLHNGTKWAEMEMYPAYHSAAEIAAIQQEIKDVSAWMTNHAAAYEDELTNYSEPYYDTMLPSTHADFDKITRFYTAEEAKGKGHLIDIALYATAKEYKTAVDAGYTCYANICDKYNGLGSYYSIGYNFGLGLRTLGGVSRGYTEGASNVNGMFDNVKNTILYAMNSGDVVDVIGADFNLKDLDTLSMTVDGRPLMGIINGNTVSFDGGRYRVTYVPDEPEKLLWRVNTPVPVTAPITLSYTLRLVQKKARVGSYEVPTNESAELTYETPIGTSETALFPEPYVHYTVQPDAPPVTGDSTPLIALFAMLTAAGIGCILPVRRHRRMP